MGLTGINIFDLAQKRLQWAAQRQGVLAGNIANATTPGYQARDIEPFSAMLAGAWTLPLARTSPGQMAGTIPSGLASLTTHRPAEHSLDGNSVEMDQQLTKVADTQTTQMLATSIWRTYMGMFSSALGQSGGA